MSKANCYSYRCSVSVNIIVNKHYMQRDKSDDQLNIKSTDLKNA